MPHRLFDRIRRIKQVDREYAAVRLGTDRLLGQVGHDPTILEESIRVRDLKNASRNLEGTYLVRLFAEFETGLRLFWESVRPARNPRGRELIDGVGARRQIPADDINAVHCVRNYRNHLVHERDDPVTPVPIAKARHHLCKYFSRLPHEW